MRKCFAVVAALSISAFLLAAKKEAADKKEENSTKKEESSSASANLNPMDCTVIIKNSEGVGTGILAKAKDTYVIVTNAHVVMGSGNAICDQHGTAIPYESIGIDNMGRDLAVFSVKPELLKDKPHFQLNLLDENCYEMGKDVTVFGNNAGMNVLTKEKGKIVGIGPDFIEIDAKIVPGASGGPVIIKDGGQCVALVTFIVQDVQDWTNKGTRYEKPRRFAIRLDGIGQFAKVESTTLSIIGKVRTFERECFDFFKCFASDYNKSRNNPALSSDLSAKYSAQLASLKAAYKKVFGPWERIRLSENIPSKLIAQTNKETDNCQKIFSIIDKYISPSSSKPATSNASSSTSRKTNYK